MMTDNKYDNPYRVHVIPGKANYIDLPESKTEWMSFVGKALYNNYFIKGISNDSIFNDYNFQDESIKAYILSDNAKNIYINHYGITTPFPCNDDFDNIVNSTCKKLVIYRKSTKLS